MWDLLRVVRMGPSGASMEPHFGNHIVNGHSALFDAHQVIERFLLFLTRSSVLAIRD